LYKGILGRLDLDKDLLRIKDHLRRITSLSFNFSLEKSSSSPIYKGFRYTSNIAFVSLCSLLLGGCLPDLGGGGSSGDSSLSSGTVSFPDSTIIQCSSGGSTDLSGACRNIAALTPGALEAIGFEGVVSANASMGVFAVPQQTADPQQTSDGSVADTLNINWSPYSESVSGYLVYFGATPETATTLASDLSSDTSNFDASAPSISYQPMLDLGLSTGDTVCFRIQAYDTAHVPYDWAEVQCTAV
jgi:hypothetical protein